MIKEFIDMPRLERWVGQTFRFLSPNTWTTVSLLVSAVAFVVVWIGHSGWGAALFGLGSLLDVVDGKVARLTGRSTKLGAFWDGTVDRFVDMLMILCLFKLPMPDPLLPQEILLFLLLFTTVLPPFIVAYANHRGAVPDPTEKVIWRFAFRIEYVILFVGAILLHGRSPLWSLYFVYASLVLMIATVIQSIILVFIKSKNYPQQ
jgi:phosphatidylglycerophosphate synthase